MRRPASGDLARCVRNAAIPLEGGACDYDDLVRLAATRRVVFLGEATHGSHELYRERIRITQRLVREEGFSAVAVEADWPDAARVNAYVRGTGNDADAVDALGGFQRFPTWMWRNADVLDFVGWLRDWNDRCEDDLDKAGFYGLDLYGMNLSIAAVLRYLDRIDPDAAQRARQRYSCFDHFGEDAERYGYATSFGIAEPCERAVIEQLVELQRLSASRAEHDGPRLDDELFQARENARLVKNAERYYRAMFRGGVSAWNLRDEHMAESLDALLEHLDARRPGAKVVVWAHNSHVGDARATEMGDAGELALGQLARERFGDGALLVGFTTYEGTVTAASTWGEPAERKSVRPALPGSYEAIFHESRLPAFYLPIAEARELRQALSERRLERAIGVVYRPESERLSHYFEARLADQFDAIVHLDETRAVEPLERWAAWRAGEAPETFPSSL